MTEVSASERPAPSLPLREIPGSRVLVPVMGQGTWGMGESRAAFAREVEALRLGVELGMTLIDTAELYAAGGAERVVGEAVRDCRERVFLVTKIWPSNAGRREALAALAGSLGRLRTDYVDAVLLHWPTRSVPLAETLAAFREMQERGLARFTGVSNFNLPWLQAAWQALQPGQHLAFNEVPYGLGDRRAERSVLPWARERGQLLLAYSPLAHGRFRRWAGWDRLEGMARRLGVPPAQLALAWLVRQPAVVAIPKAVQPGHVRQNAEAARLPLEEATLAELEAAFPRPPRELRPQLPPYNLFFGLVLAATRLTAQGARA
ncbi:MAG: aldo/keto reductase [Bacillota bacterium]|nr:aldo/keto reductase [Bacillota bacterium]